ncbi:chemotaxis protein CheW [Pseudanabaena sp. FACHB-1998]|uniref:chemotaxis protein CheW n=1 Tax=Pseudanabaena sp. FACHB-1998 TaxID=2692858 RepID=UPI001681427C|nr:chemotaxis protein CheW [Pseudanabaena sp. FACHB-1998]MBD2175746.1 chemotaxis protein CheW [Pseudanabaena sp. FACHB-1998]
MYKLSENVDRIQDFKTDFRKEANSDTCLKFAIDPQTIGLLESEFTQEVLTLKASLVMPVPNKPSCVLGILSRRRRVYWAIDLAMLLGLQPLDQNIRLYEVILTSVQELSLALIVPKIFGVVHLDSDQIEHDIFSAPAILKPYLKGYFREKGETAYLLRAENILRSTILHS